VAEHLQRKPPTRAQLVRDHLTLEIRPVRSLLSGLMGLPWEATSDHPVLAAIHLLKDLYKQGARKLPTTPTIDLGRVWRALLSGADRDGVWRHPGPRHLDVGGRDGTRDSTTLRNHDSPSDALGRR
jgi:hypothetical protein